MLSYIKFGFEGTAASRRQTLLRNQGTTVYDIFKIHYTFELSTAVNAAEVILAALSARLDDQVEDEVVLPIIDFHNAQGVFGAMAWNSDLEVEGANSSLNTYDVDFPDNHPFTVPFAAFIGSVLATGFGRLGVELYFERRVVPALEKATLVRIMSGGRTRTS